MWPQTGSCSRAIYALGCTCSLGRPCQRLQAEVTAGYGKASNDWGHTTGNWAGVPVWYGSYFLQLVTMCCFFVEFYNHISEWVVSVPFSQQFHKQKDEMLNEEKHSNETFQLTCKCLERSFFETNFCLNWQFSRKISVTWHKMDRKTLLTTSVICSERLSQPSLLWPETKFSPWLIAVLA